MVTLAPNPPGQDELTEYTTEQPAAAWAAPAIKPVADTATATAAAGLAARAAIVRLPVLTLPRRYGWKRSPDRHGSVQVRSTERATSSMCRRSRHWQVSTKDSMLDPESFGVLRRVRGHTGAARADSCPTVGE